jgi:hemerythrin-like domain-containing protein
MLNTITGAAAASTTSEDAISLLLGCHQRIRHFTGVAQRLAESPEAPPDDRTAAAIAVLRYFTVALPLHEADENESVFPRLRAALPAGPLLEANSAMVEQHRALNAALAQLIPLWRRIEHEPAAQPTLTAALIENTQQMKGLWDVHLRLEEETVFPAMQQFLDARGLEEIRGEMRTRRQN